MTVFTGWLFLSVGCSIGFVAGSLFTAGVWVLMRPAAERGSQQRAKGHRVKRELARRWRTLEPVQ